MAKLNENGNWLQQGHIYQKNKHNEFIIDTVDSDTVIQKPFSKFKKKFAFFRKFQSIKRIFLNFNQMVSNATPIHLQKFAQQYLFLKWSCFY